MPHIRWGNCLERRRGWTCWPVFCARVSAALLGWVSCWLCHVKRRSSGGQNSSATFQVQWRAARLSAPILFFCRLFLFTCSRVWCVFPITSRRSNINERSDAVYTFCSRLKPDSWRKQFIAVECLVSWIAVELLHWPHYLLVRVDRFVCACSD